MLVNINRKEEIAQVLSVIQDLCETYEISLLPYTCEDGTQLVIVEDAQNGEKYALYIGE